jgi:hypothetical protein
MGQHINSNTSGAVTINIPTNATTSFPIGSTVSLVLQGTGSMTVVPASGVTLRLAGTSQQGNRTVPSYGIGSIMKIGLDTWIISGQGVS